MEVIPLDGIPHWDKTGHTVQSKKSSYMVKFTACKGTNCI